MAYSVLLIAYGRIYMSQAICHQLYESEYMNRRDFLTRGLISVTSIAIAGCRGFEAAEHRYQLAPESILPADIASAPDEVREAYRFAILNRDTLRYIPCYCGCGSDGHTSNASCYFKDNSTPANPVFDRMSLA
jgi:hypothetical protein